MIRFLSYVTAAFIGLAGLQAMAGTDGVWRVGGSGTAQWSDPANWADDAVADGQDATARFNSVDVGNLHIDLGGGTRTVGHLIFDDAGVAVGDWWDIANGTLNLSVSVGLPTIEINHVSGGVGVPATIVGDFRKTGNRNLYLKSMPGGSIDIAEGTVCFAMNSDDMAFTTQSISGSGGVEYLDQHQGYYTFRSGQYSGTLSYTGHTVVELTPGQGTWWEGTLWLEKDDVLPHATVLDLHSGKIYLRAQTGNGISVAGLTGNAGTFITTDRQPWELQKLTVNVAEGETYAYAGTIGADGSGVGNNNLTLTKAGKGTQALSGANTFVGPLTVSEGTLLVNNAAGSGTGIGNSVTVSSGAALGGSGTIQGSTSLGAGCGLTPRGTLTTADLTMGAGLSYLWVRETSADSLVRVLGNVSFPSSATVTVTRTDGAVYPPGQGVLFTWAGENTGATDLSGWTVLAADGTCLANGCTYDADNKRVLFAISNATGTDGVWNYSGTMEAPESAWTDTGRWTSGVVPAGYNAVAHFDAADEIQQYINLNGGTQVVGRIVFWDAAPVGDGSNWWSLRNGTLTPYSTTGDLTLEVSNAVAYLESAHGGFLRICGPLVKTGAGMLVERGQQTGAVDVRAGTLRLEEKGSFAGVKLAAGTTLWIENWDVGVVMTPSVLSISGAGDVFLSTLVNGFISLRGGQTYTGKTTIKTPPMADANRRVYVEEVDNGMATGSVVNIEQGCLVLRSSQQLAGLEGSGFVMNDHTWKMNTLTLAVAGGSSLTYSGLISDTLGLVKNGAGTQVLTGANTFSGDVAVNEGALLVNNATGSGSGLGSGVTVASGATLGGTGTLLNANAVLQPGASLAPGGIGTVGTLAFGGSLWLAEGVTYGADYMGAGSDSVSVGGTLTLPATLTVQLSAFESAALPKRVTLFTAGALAGATDLRDWQVSGSGERKYEVGIEGLKVIARLIPAGTFISIR